MEAPMIRRLFLAAAAAVIAAPAMGAKAVARDSARRAHDFAFTDIDGAPLPLLQFRGRPVLIVNTASQCGFTGQYAGLQKLWATYRDRGLTVIGVPSDDFRQELDSAAQVKAFCELNYGVDFPLTEISHVRGPNAHPFYAWAREVLGESLAPRWNFHKYLVDGEGRLVAAFSTGTEPMSRTVTAAVEKLLPGA
jgi:glutathione peroxidase